MFDFDFDATLSISTGGGGLKIDGEKTELMGFLSPWLRSINCLICLAALPPLWELPLGEFGFVGVTFLRFFFVTPSSKDCINHVEKSFRRFELFASKGLAPFFSSKLLVLLPSEISRDCKDRAFNSSL